jgi:hypothetical protein
LPCGGIDQDTIATSFRKWHAVRVKNIWLVCLIILSLQGRGWAQESHGGDSYDEVGLEQKISPAMMRWFRAGLPADAAGLGIALGKVLSVKIARYCEQGGPQCGFNPTCGHSPLTWGTTSSYQINGLIIRRHGVKAPEKIENYVNAPGANSLRAGEQVWIAFHTLKSNQVLRVSLVERVPQPKSSTASSSNTPAAKP